MFSGIVEAQTTVLRTSRDLHIVRIVVEKPLEFNDLKIGDSIATNGVCLTVEAFDANSMIFALGAETLQVTGWTAENLKDQRLNLERSLRFGDRVHGHMVSGHVDGIGELVASEDLGGCTRLDIRVPRELEPYIWKKGSLAVNGVSLTINSIVAGVVSHVLIPETLKRTNLGCLKAGDKVNLEVDFLARGLLRALELGVIERGWNPSKGEQA
jgi:riboflavin synthase